MQAQWKQIFAAKAPSTMNCKHCDKQFSTKKALRILVTKRHVGGQPKEEKEIVQKQPVRRRYTLGMKRRVVRQMEKLDPAERDNKLKSMKIPKKTFLKWIHPATKKRILDGAVVRAQSKNLYAKRLRR